MASASYSTRTGRLTSLHQRFALLFLWLLLQANLISCDYGNAVYSPFKKLSTRADPPYENRVEKGRGLKCQFPLTAEEVTQSPWQDSAALDRWGWWAEDVDWTGGSPLFGDSLDKAFADVNIDKKKNGYSAYTHAKSFTKADGKRGEPTGGEYGQSVNPEGGSIVFDSNFGPAFYIKDFQTGDMPALEKLSDVAFFQWVAACDEKGVSPGNIKYAFRAHITLQSTFDIVTQALQRAGHQQVPDWDNRVKFTMDQDPGLGILGSVHGSGVAFFLLQHKAKLGLKKITEVTVWSSTGAFDFQADPEDNWLNLRFKIENV